MQKIIIIEICMLLLILLVGCSENYNPKSQICDMTCGERMKYGFSIDIKTPLYDRLCFNKDKFCENCCLYWHDWKENESITRFKLYSARLFTEGGGYYLRDLDCKITWRQDLGIIYHHMECNVERVSDDIISKYGKIDAEIQIKEYNQTNR